MSHLEEEFSGVQKRYALSWSKDGRFVSLPHPDHHGVIPVTYEVLAELLTAAGWQPQEIRFRYGTSV